MHSGVTPRASDTPQPSTRLACLRALEQKTLWLASWMVHHANHRRENRDGLKVGGHQASSASLVTVMTALFFDVLGKADRVAVKPHASPVLHAIQYLLGRQTLDKLQRFRALGGAQSYPSRTKDTTDVDFSTGSVGLGVAMTTFASLTQEYLHARGLAGTERGRMVALAGDAEFDEGNVFEALLEGWKHDVRNLWWIIDYNRQSLDAIVADRLHHRFDTLFRDMGWRVVTVKYGSLLERAFQRRGGDALRDWFDGCSNALHAGLTVQGGRAWRRQLLADLGDVSGIRELLDEHDDERLQRLMTNLGGHDLVKLLDAFESARDEQPTCFLAYTIKGYGLPFAAHKDNHAGLMSPDQIAALKASMNIRDGEEWERFAGLDVSERELQPFLASLPIYGAPRRMHAAPRVAVPASLNVTGKDVASTQEGFGRILAGIARQHPALADRIVTTAPDVTVSTNLGPWVNRRGVFGRERRPELPADARVASAQSWDVTPKGQHIELGIAENNLFIALAALGLAGPLFGTRLLPIGTVYDPFIARGLDALNYACYQDARFILVATPSGLTLAPEGGAHQSLTTPLIGIGQPGLTMFEPTYVDELAEMLRWSLERLQADDGGSVYLRLSTRMLPQPVREFTSALAHDVVEGGYWLVPPTDGAELAIVCCGPVIPEVMSAREQIADDMDGIGVLVVTSADRLHEGWRRARTSRESSHVERLLEPIAAAGGLVTVLDGHPATLSWLGAVSGHAVAPLGVSRFGQSGDIPDLYRIYGLDADAIVEAAARLSVERA
jgi:pyruvate dehydrogenase E1 component